MNNTQLKRLNQVVNKIIINSKVFPTRVKYIISKEISDTKVVREQGGRQLHWCKKFRHQQFHPLQFDSSSCNCTILSLRGRISNSALLWRTLGNWISTKENKKRTCGGTIIRVTIKIRIRKTMQCQRSVYKKPDTKGSRSIKITKETFDCSPMVFEWCVHKLGEFIHDKGNVWSRHPEMLEATNHLMLHGGIDRRSTIFSSKRRTYDKQCRDRFGV